VRLQDEGGQCPICRTQVSAITDVGAHIAQQFALG
jgi:hypothetical protein